LWIGAFTGKEFTKASDVDIDHKIPVKYAHDHSGADWSPLLKRLFANWLHTMKKLLLLLLLFPALVFGQEVYYENYDECILDRLAGISSDIAAQAIIKSCENLSSSEPIKMVSKNIQTVEQESVSQISEKITESISTDEKKINAEFQDIEIYKNTLPDGSFYVGQFKDGQRNGQGTFTGADGSIAKGNWIDDQLNGFGTYIYANGDTYVGGFENSRRHGKGTYTSKSELGDFSYQGEFKNDNYSGHGTFSINWRDVRGILIGIVYEGAFLDGTYYGYGNFTRTEGGNVVEVYTGEFKKGMREGLGTYSSRGDTFDGIWKDEAAVDGVYTYSNGDIYSGEFKNGRHHGKGTLTFADGSVYSGEFKNGRHHGKGTLTFADGSVYKGDFKYGVMHGEGVYNAIDYTFNGNWLYNKASGYGVYADKQGAVYIGEWQNGLRNGQGTNTSIEGEIDIGIWKNNKILRRN
jgi:hypothetical protein